MDGRPDYAEIRAARIATARTKILRVLRAQTVCHQRELERRICEVGFSFYPLAPQAERPEPVHLNAARDALREADRIDSMTRTYKGNPYTFFHLADADPAAVAAAIGAKFAAAKAFDVIQHNRLLSGFAAESLYYHAMLSAPNLFTLPYEPGRDPTIVNGRESDRGIDLAGIDLEARVTIAVQVKNTREWIYPDSAAVWTLLVTAAQLEAVPVLIARRAAEPTYLFMRDVGGYVVEAMNHFVHRDAQQRADWPRFVSAAATLGYKDVKVIDPEDPPARFRSLFTTRLAGNLASMYATFDRHRDFIVTIGKLEGLWDDTTRAGHVSGLPRRDVFASAWRSFRGKEDAPHPDEF